MSSYNETETIGLLYDAALGQAAWSDAGKRLVSAVDGATLSFTAQYELQGGVDLIDMQGVTPEQVALYAAHYFGDDLWRNAAIGRRITDTAILGSDLVSDLEWRHSRIYAELSRPHTDVFHGVMVAAGMLPQGGGVFSLGIHRPRLARPFDQGDRDRLQGLLPHIRRAVQIRSRLGSESVRSDASAATLDKLSFGIVHLTATGRFVAANAAAHRILRDKDGLALGPTGVHAASHASDSRLQEAVLRAACTTAGKDGGDAGSYLRLERPSGLRPYTVIVTPLGLGRPVLLPGTPAVLLIVTDPEAAPRIEASALSALFGLTPAEARLVTLLVTGLSLPEVARRQGIGFETARTHLTRARAKTGTASQVDLIRAVLLALAPIGTASR